MRNGKQNGFSLLELTITVGIALTMSAVSFLALRPMLNTTHVDSAYDTTLMALRNTRNLAITQSHEYIVTFNPAGFSAGTILVQYQPAAVGGVAQPIEQVITYTIPTDVQFAVQAGFPTNAPDGFDTGTFPIDFGYGIPGEAQLQYVVFMPDGSSQDTLGNYNSGIVYLTRPGDTLSNSRAITVSGATGRVRGWRMGQQAGGVWTWTQQ